MKKSLLAVICAGSLMLAAPIAHSHDNNGHRHHHGADHSSKHGHRHNHSDTGIAIAAGAVALIAAAAAAKAHEGNPNYSYHHGYGSRSNAISACLHKAQRRTARRGGHGVTLRNVRRANFNGSNWRVALAVKQRLQGGVRRNVVARCTVVGSNVTQFNFR